MKITIPTFSLIILIGVSGSGKSTFARKHFKLTEVLSSDYCRALISDDENDQTVTKEAFQILHFILSKRLEKRRLTVVDATNVLPQSRLSLINIANRFDAALTAIVFNFAEEVLLSRLAGRTDRRFDAEVIHAQVKQLQESFDSLKTEGFKQIIELKTPEEVDAVTFERVDESPI